MLRQQRQREREEEEEREDLRWMAAASSVLDKFMDKERDKEEAKPSLKEEKRSFAPTPGFDSSDAEALRRQLRREDKEYKLMR